MDNIIIEPTKKTPYVEFSCNGKLVLAGSAQSENAHEFFYPLIQWIKNLNTEKVDFDLILEYINTASAKKLFELLKNLKTNPRIKQLTINWYYQKEDVDHLETGQILAEALGNVKFNYVIYDR